MGILWGVIFVAGLVFGSSDVTRLLSVVMAAFYLGMFFWQTKRSYLSVKDGVLIKDLGAKIPIGAITETYRFAGEYSFRSAQRKILVDTNLVDRDSMPLLEDLINEIRGVKPVSDKSIE